MLKNLAGFIALLSKINDSIKYFFLTFEHSPVSQRVINLNVDMNKDPVQSF